MMTCLAQDVKAKFEVYRDKNEVLLSIKNENLIGFSGKSPTFRLVVSMAIGKTPERQDDTGRS